VVEMALPWVLLADAERRLPSSLTGLLVATVPLMGTLVAFGLGDRDVLRPVRLVGLALGLAGVALVVGLGQGGTVEVVPVLEVLLVAACYTTGPFVATRYLIDVPGIGVVAIATTAVALAFLVPAIATAPERFPSGSALAALVGLGLLCTAIAFTVFFALMDEVGPVKCSLITFVNPAVAITLGVLLLDEPLTVGLVIGFPLVIAGCWLVSRHHAPTAELPVAMADGGPRNVTPITVD
jgi:drug/metabolite transporter (DMT)-like permease